MKKQEQRGTGSSPRMRGAPDPGRVCGPGRGIIPADAGSTRTGRQATHGSRDHPRGCGEHHIMLDVWQSFQGSSPRMRGARSTPSVTASSWRIIPADAGSTVLIVGVVVAIGDHPRGYGEHAKLMLNNLYGKGSSPRMRGAHRWYHPGWWVPRIIPADAGSTTGKDYCTDHWQDHPRGCGEHILNCIGLFRGVGSSPRMRGALADRGDGLLQGIIPADAGST